MTIVKLYYMYYMNRKTILTTCIFRQCMHILDIFYVTFATLACIIFCLIDLMTNKDKLMLANISRTILFDDYYQIINKYIRCTTLLPPFSYKWL